MQHHLCGGVIIPNNSRVAYNATVHCHSLFVSDTISYLLGTVSSLCFRDISKLFLCASVATLSRCSDITFISEWLGCAQPLQHSIFAYGRFPFSAWLMFFSLEWLLCRKCLHSAIVVVAPCRLALILSWTSFVTPLPRCNIFYSPGGPPACSYTGQSFQLDSYAHGLLFSLGVAPFHQLRSSRFVQLSLSSVEISLALISGCFRKRLTHTTLRKVSLLPCSWSPL